ncbi:MULTISPECIES: HI1506-related protein [unclassified Neptuniibacter]|uniref:HI1506-related protein n=1 Tax=unclassified Neptuniibacter TaxID=2630693 RepID=UPI0025FF4931|nr:MULTISPECIES: HI1506-related protein [unclassified Neptuniibacter]
MSKYAIHAAIVVISSVLSGYRRGGVELEQGPNPFEADHFTKEQLQQLNEDPRLTLLEGENADTEDSTAHGTVDSDRLAELVEHIKGLDTADTSLWKEDQTPKAAAYPKGTTAEEREAAWDAFVSQLDGAE